jgi:uncharacterized protein (TIGR02996 family)
MAPADEQPFLDAVLTRPHDDGPRLVYADFLDETGDPADAARAEFIRVQLALTKLPDDHPRRPALIDREAELKAAHRDRWTAHLAGLGTDVTADFDRGIPDAVSIDAADFLANGAELFRSGPVRKVQLRDAARVLPQLVNSPLLARVRDLDLCGRDLGNGGVNLLVRSPHLAGVRALDLGFNGLDDAGVRLLAKASTLPGLRELSLSGNEQITADGVRFLAESPFLAGLTALDLSGNDVNDSGVRALVSAPTMARLRTLRIDRNHIGDAGVAALIGSGLIRRSLARSPRLDLRANNVGPVGAGLLARWPGLARVTHLDLGGNYLGNAGLSALLGSPHLSRVRSLRLGRNQITDKGAGAIRENFYRLFDQLRVLDLSGNRLTRHGIIVLEEARGTKPLALDLTGNAQPASGGEVPVPVGDVLDEVAELRRRVWNPARRDGT